MPSVRMSTGRSLVGCPKVNKAAQFNSSSSLSLLSTTRAFITYRVREGFESAHEIGEIVADGSGGTIAALI